MREKSILYFALGVLTVVSIGAVKFQDTGITFPDGTFQSTAAAGVTAGTAVQGSVSLSIVGIGFCTDYVTLYSVPSGKRLVVQWMSANQVRLFGPAVDPADLFLQTWDGSQVVSHNLVRFSNPASRAGTLGPSEPWSSTVLLYSEGGGDFEARFCVDAELTDEAVGTVTFSGYLIDV